MTQIERSSPFTTDPKSIFDRLPFLGNIRERKRIERGEDELSIRVINHLMSILETDGFTVTYVMDRALMIAESSGEETYVTDTSNITQEQKVILKGKDGKAYRVKLRSDQSKEGSQISHNGLSLSVKDNIEEGPQRFVAFYKAQWMPGFWRQKNEEHTGREFYGIHAKDWRFKSWFNLEEEVYPVFLKEILNSSVDIEATQEDYERFNAERKSQSSIRSKVMRSVLWNNKPNGLLS